MSGYRFGRLEDRLLRLCRAAQPNPEKIRQCISDGADVNTVNCDGENLLTVVFQTRTHGEKLPLVTRLLLDAGFDARLHGMGCLSSLVYSPFGRSAFAAAKLLLMAGADGTEEVWQDLLEAIAIEESFQRCGAKDHEGENLSYALYELVDCARRKANYSDLDLWTAFIGQKISAVCAVAWEGEPMEASSDGKNMLPKRLLICSEAKALIIEANPNIYVRANPVPDLDREKCVPVRALDAALGGTVADISFAHGEHRKGMTVYRQPIICVSLDSGACIRFTTNFGEVPEDDAAAYFEVLR